MYAKMLLFPLIFCLHIVQGILVKADPRIEKGPKNSTVYVDSRHIFACDAIGELPIQITWQHNSKNMPDKGRNYKITKRGKLKLLKVDTSQSGYYRCIARNSQGTAYSNQGYLTVEAPVVIVNGPTPRRVNFGTEVILECYAVGFPQPHIAWFKNGTKILDPDTETVFSERYLHLNATETATYKCQAWNHHTNSTTIVNATATVTVKEPEKPKTGKCMPYAGTICKHYLGQRNVYYNVSDLTSNVTNESIVNNLWTELLTTAKGRCQHPAEKMLCHYAFPDCDITEDDPIAKPLCKENCLALQQYFCLSEWVQTLQNKKEGNYFPSRGHFRLPICNELPSKKNKSSCSEVDLFNITQDKITTKCVKGLGTYYKGNVNVTQSGIPCQAWTSQTPHQHNRTPDVFPILEDSYNYCRNAVGEEEGPWCYTMDSGMRWERCNVPSCDVVVAVLSSTTPMDGVQGEKVDTFTLTNILIITAVAVVSVSLIVCVVMFCHRMVEQKNRLHYNTTPQDDLDIDIEKLPSNVSYHSSPSASVIHPKLEKLEYPRNDVVYIRDIGQGAFGRVFKAKVPHLLKGQDQAEVAVKMLKDDATEEMQKDFEREATLMVEFNHKNIVKLLGVCAIGRPMCLLFEYMSKGDLNEFLRTCSPEHFIVRRRSNELLASDMPKLDHVEQIHIAKQIAAGMVYISEKGYVHRDLATRNCLVGEGLTVKISDFGLTRCLPDSDYYCGSEHEAIPIRWMPLEAIWYNRFTTESDVWSFGVVLWEIFSFALQPYYGMTHEEVVKYIKDGKVLSCPDNTPQEVYEIMRTCWEKNPSQRLRFPILHKQICSLNLMKVKKKREKFTQV